MQKETLSTVPGFDPGSFDCRSILQPTELHGRPTSLSPQESNFSIYNLFTFWTFIEPQLIIEDFMLRNLKIEFIFK